MVGPHTREEFGRLVSWLEKTALPAQFKRLEDLGMPTDTYAKQLREVLQDPKYQQNPKLHDQTLGRAADGTVHLGINTEVSPTDNDLNRLFLTVNEMKKIAAAGNKAEQNLAQNELKATEAVVKSENLRVSWLNKEGKDRQIWEESLKRLTALALKTRQYIQVMDELHRSTGGKFPYNAPNNSQIERGEDGRITGIDLKLPKEADFNNPETKKWIDEKSKYLQQNSQLMEPLLKQLRDVKEHPEQALSWGDLQLKQTQGRFDKDDNFLGYVPKGTKTREGEQLKDMNLLESRMDVSEEGGLIKVNQQVQAQKVPWYGYQDMVWDNVGKNKEIKRDFAPDDWVVVRNNNEVDVMQAKDLASHITWEKAKHRGLKGLVGTVDGLLIASGISELRAGATLARAGAEAGAELAGRALAEQTGKVVLTEALEKATASTAAESYLSLGRYMSASNALKFRGAWNVGLGATGWFNNAGALDTESGAQINHARGVYFLLHIGANTLRGVYRGAAWGFNKASAAIFGETAAVAESTPQAIQAGAELVPPVQQLSRAERFLQFAGDKIDWGFMPIVLPEAHREIRRSFSKEHASTNRAYKVANRLLPARQQLQDNTAHGQ